MHGGLTLPAGAVFTIPDAGYKPHTDNCTQLQLTADSSCSYDIISTVQSQLSELEYCIGREGQGTIHAWVWSILAPFREAEVHIVM